ncbi:DUF4224 domain-containing protein [Luteibacter sp. UNCMF331Sha3.1]|uniref:DUF4224 domain-containing protein n=1 Tax=Luteibacter sp. UNCMF331Sha3.1 TaxID=1502760 RepID=UPI000B7E0CFA|nr:DUF4224 domain-containing protein [Luteibacter sp. UNCMF331Sha3.1]
MRPDTQEPVFLTLDQVKELTGAGTRRTVIATLLKNGIRHHIRADGWPVVAWAAITGVPASAPPPRPKWRSNLDTRGV